MASLHELFNLQGRVAVVTGGSRGLGLQIADALGEYGVSLALVARRRTDLEKACATLGAQGIVAEAFEADLSDRQSFDALVAQIAGKLGRIDILINNAATTWGAPAEEFPDDGWDKVLALGLTASFAMTRAVAARCFLPGGGGAVVNIASIAGIIGHMDTRIGTVAYNAAKGGVISMTRALAAEWGGRNIRVNAIAPGYFPSKMTAALIDKHQDEMLCLTPRGRLGGSDDLKGAALLLASDAGAHITGQTIVVDGGMTIV